MHILLCNYRAIGTGHPNTNHNTHRFFSMFCVNVNSSAYSRGASYDDFRFRTNQYPELIQQLQWCVSSSSRGNIRLFPLNTQCEWSTVYRIDEKCRNTGHFIYAFNTWTGHRIKNVCRTFRSERQRLCSHIQRWIWIYRKRLLWQQFICRISYNVIIL